MVVAALRPFGELRLIGWSAHHRRDYTAGGGRFARLFIGSTQGAVTDDVEAHWKQINDEAHFFIPADLLEWSAQFLGHLQ